MRLIWIPTGFNFVLNQSEICLYSPIPLVSTRNWKFSAGLNSSDVFLWLLRFPSKQPSDVLEFFNKCLIFNFSSYRFLTKKKLKIYSNVPHFISDEKWKLDSEIPTSSELGRRRERRRLQNRLKVDLNDLGHCS